MFLILNELIRSIRIVSPKFQQISRLGRRQRPAKLSSTVHAILSGNNR